MKKVVLTALNARYFHTNLAVRCLKAAAGNSYDIKIIERTINDNLDDITEQILTKKPDALGFSCYIWNIEQVLKIAADIKKIKPDCYIFLGGPEVSFEYKQMLAEHDFIDMIILNEGEITFKNWISAFENEHDFSGLKGTVQKNADEIVINQQQDKQFDLTYLPFLYDDLSEYQNKIIYFETSRGCPFYCTYCMSGLKGAMTYMDIEKIEYAFEYFLKNDVKQVKLVDRTFNFPMDRAKEIIEILIGISKKYPKSKTNFHFEITAALIDDEMLSILKSAPQGLIQFEIGIQSTNKETLKAINRNFDNDKLFENIKSIIAIENIIVFVDLIAGLPKESYSSFKKSFNDVYHLNSDKIHLGFLKVLKGSDIRCNVKEYGIAYKSTAPYKVLKTNDISYEELCLLDKIEKLIELYKNSKHFEKTFLYALSFYNTPFDFFESFMVFAKGLKFFGKNHKIVAQFDILYEFLTGNKNINNKILHEKMLYDWVLLEKPRRYPQHLKTEYSNEEKQLIRQFFNDKENIKKYLPDYLDYTSATISRMCHVVFLIKSEKIILYDYNKDKKNRTQLITFQNKNLHL